MKDSDEEIIKDEEIENPGAALKKLRDRLATAVKEKQEYLEGWQRSRADFANFKKQEAMFSEENAANLKANLIEKLLPALDALELAGTHASEQSKMEFKLVQQQFFGALKELGIEPIEASNHFDPNKHEVLQEIPTDDHALDGTIKQIFRTGYISGDKIIRPAQVALYIQK
jgi:molecular chaperone GrpE